MRVSLEDILLLFFRFCLPEMIRLLLINPFGSGYKKLGAAAVNAGALLRAGARLFTGARGLRFPLALLHLVGALPVGPCINALVDM